MQNYEELEIIGRGSFGTIRKVRRRSDGRVLARKEIDYKGMTTQQKKQLVSEVNILRELKHPNIVRYYDRYVDKEHGMIYILMEYCSHGDLAALIRRCKREGKMFSEEIIWSVLSQLLLALDECHHGITSKGVILHRDIKPENVFLDGDNVKLGDFGLSRLIDKPENEMAKTFVGTPYYMSPELVNETNYDTKSDIWSLGCLIYEMCSLKPPFEAETHAQLYERISTARIEPLPPKYSRALDDTVKLMLTQNKSSRPGSKELLQHERIKWCVNLQNIRIREQILNEKEAFLTRKEKDLMIIEADLISREDSVKSRELAIDMKENQLEERLIEFQSAKRTSMETKFKEDRFLKPRTPARNRDYNKSILVSTPSAAEKELSMMVMSPYIDNNLLRVPYSNSSPPTTPITRLLNGDVCEKISKIRI